MTEVAPPTINVQQQEGSPSTQEPNGAAVNGSSAPAAIIEETTVVTAVANGGSTKAKKVQKEPEPPKDPKEDPFGWVQQQSKAAKHKVNYELLQWTQNQAVDEEAKRPTLPGKTDKVTTTQFLGHLRDGSLLAKLANALSPGSVETVHEGEELKTNKEQQTSNLQSFINFAKEKAGLPEDQVFTMADIQEKGKAGYEAVFKTLFQVASKAQEKFNQAAIDVDRIVQEASVLVDPSILQKALAYFPLHLFKRTGTSAADKSQATQNGEGEKQENGTANGEKVNEAEQQQVILTEATVPVTVAPSTETAPAVATN